MSFLDWLDDRELEKLDPAKVQKEMKRLAVEQRVDRQLGRLRDETGREPAAVTFGKKTGNKAGLDDSKAVSKRTKGRSR